MARGPAVHTLSIFLLKEDVQTVTQSLANPTGLERVPVGSGRGKIGDLYVRQSPRTPPRWLKFFLGALSSKPPPLYNASNAAVLLARAGGRTFALCFGQGRHLLAEGSWEENFGLRVTLNCVDPKRLRSIDRRTFDAYTSHTRTQTSIEGDVTAFGLDVEQDLLRAATGQPVANGLGRRMTGMDSLTVAVATTPKALPDLLSRYSEEFGKDSYKAAFPWVDHIGEVREPRSRAELDQELLAVISETGASSPKAWLAVPTLIEWARIDGFTYSTSSKAPRFDDLEIRDFLASLEDLTSLTIERLHQRRVHAVGVEDGTILDKWPVYECLYAEIEKGGATYLLTGGKWYRVERDFVRTVNRDVKRLVAGTTLPRYEDRSEHDYNKRVAEGSGGDLAFLDRKLVKIGGTTVETCDLYSRGGQFIHVKRYGGSSVLSHLFAQGSVSANSFVQDPQFREAFNDLLPNTHRLLDASQRPDAGRFAVVYAVVSNSTDPIDRSLPFFSRLNLRNAARQLSGYGFKVSLTKIQA
jgi:uncharacterized protein (TIGR04141 family)